MKKLLTVVFGIIMACNIHAAEVIPIVWPYSLASKQAAALRLIIEDANKSQSKYTFVLESKPGAGGSIGVNYLLQRKVPTLLMNSTSVFLRPYYYPDQSYDVSQLQPVVVVSDRIPVVLFSKNIKSFADLEKQKTLSIGITSGGIFEKTAQIIKEHLKNTDVLLVPYPNQLDASRDMMGGQIDFTMEFYGSALQWVETGKIKVLGISGTKAVDPFNTVSSQGFKGLDNIFADNYIIASKEMDKKLVEEFYEILSKAAIQPNVVKVWEDDAGSVTMRSYDQTVKYWNTQKAIWTK